MSGPQIRLPSAAKFGIQPVPLHFGHDLVVSTPDTPVPEGD